MSCVEVRDRDRDSPERARSLLTVRAAISSARDSDAPCSFSLSLMCSYCRARLVPFWTPRGGIARSFRSFGHGLPAARAGDARSTAGGRGYAYWRSSGGGADAGFDGSEQITVCFADLVGFTRLGEKLGPSDLGRLA